ncbi:MAG: XRE family transcriptional regulator [Saprospiraceae bacterium]|nr:XRE family transcriptional regulator [Saprospiraceae bacterium]
MNSFPDRLKNARKMQGYSLQDLSDRSGNTISKQDLSRLEKGEIQPNSSILALLSKALNVPLDYFFRETSVTLENIEFRKLQKLPVKEQERIKSLTREYLERYLELENILGIDVELPFSLRAFPIIDSKDIEKAALEMREKVLKIGLDPIYNIIELLEENHIKVYWVNANPSFSGMSTIVGSKIGVIVLNDHQDIPLVRKRFTVLHELGHLYLNCETFSEREAEKICDAFAGAMLLPGNKLWEYFGGKRSKIFIKELKLLKEYYGISLSALMYRAKELGLISDSYFRDFMSKYNYLYREQEKEGYVGEEISNRFLQLLIRAVAQEIISTSKAASLNNQKLAEFRDKVLDIAAK